MFFSYSLRNGIRKVSLIGLVATVVISIAVAAGPGFPFTEDFTDNSLEDTALTTADWDTISGKLRLALASDLDQMTLTRVPMGGLPEVQQTTRDIVLGDLDGDGDLDAVVGNEGVDTGGGGGPAGAANLIYFNDLSMFDLGPVPLEVDLTRTRGLAIGDLDRDGDLDIVSGNWQRPAVYYLNSDGAGNFSPGIEFSTNPSRTWKVALADVDGDGDLDFVEGNDGGRNFLHINLLVENGAFSFGSAISITGEVFSTRSLVMGDINNDGDVDLITGDQGAGNRIYSNNGSGVFTARGEINININETFSVALADLDGDEFLDLVEGNLGLPTQIYFNMGLAGLGSFDPPVALTGSNAAHTTVALLLRDFDRDGDIDILEGNNGAWDHDNDVNTASAPQPIRLFLNNGDGTFVVSTEDTPVDIQKTYGMAAGDIDGDGQLDFVTGNSSNNVGGPAALAGNAVYFNDGNDTMGPLVRQLDGVAVSLEVDGGDAAIPAARLTVDRVQPAVLADLDFFLSNDNGQNFVPVQPGGGPVAFPDANGNQLVWKVDMLTSSPNAAQLADINQIDIAPNNPPVFDNVRDIIGTEGQPLGATSLSDYFSDADVDALIYQVSGLPVGTGLSLDANTGQLSGTLTNEDALASPVTLAASAFDGAESGNGDIRLFVDTVGVNDLPIATGDGPFVADEGGMVAGNPNVLLNDFDFEGDPLMAVLVTGPANAANFVLNADGTFEYTHDGTATLADSFTYTANDADGPSSPATVTIMINPVDDPPVITLLGTTPVTITVGDAYNDAGATASDEEDGDITANIAVNSNVNTGVAGTYTVTYDVMDSGGNAAVQVTRTVTVNAAPPPPPPPRRSSGGCTVGPSDGTIDPTLPILMLISSVYLFRRRLSET